MPFKSESRVHTTFTIVTSLLLKNTLSVAQQLSCVGKSPYIYRANVIYCRSNNKEEEQR